MQIIIEETLRLSKEVMIAFLGIEKTFDNINWNIVLNVLRDIKVNYRDIRKILQPYKNKRALISRDELKVKILKGVRQGCGLSTLQYYSICT